VTRSRGRPLILAARADRYALPAFNVSNLETVQAIIAAAESAGSPVILQVSPGAIAYAGYDTLTRLVMDLADHSVVPTVVHLDHCRDIAVVARAIADGYDSVMFDGSTLPYDDNVERTAALVHAARSKDPDIAVEGELGRIGGREDTTDAQALAERTDPDDAADFVGSTGIDILAPNLGNLHRMPDDSSIVDLELVRAISSAADRPIALHGGSGIEQRLLRAAAGAGVAKVNISSRVTRALAGGIRATWDARPDELDLRRFLGAGRDAVQSMAVAYFELTGAAGRAPRAMPTDRRLSWTSDDAEPE
jgi:fructose-bisphosphate aldolase class II